MLKSKVVLVSFLSLVSIYFAYSQSEIDSNTVVYGWNLDRDLLNAVQTPIDTLLPGYQQNNRVLKKFYSLSHFGGNGSVYLSNNFFDRNTYEGLLFLNMYQENFATFHNTQFHNTRKPFTHLDYVNGGSKPDKEEGLMVSHSQNIGNKFNFGFYFQVLSNKGQYKYLNTNIKKFKAFSSYNGSWYTMHATFNTNRYLGEENGGIIDSVYLSSENEPKLIPANFSGKATSPYEAYVKNRIRYYDGMISQRIKLFTLGKAEDSLSGARSMAEPIISHVFLVRRSSKVYEDGPGNNPVNPIYHNFYSNPLETYDSIAEFRISNKVQLDFKTRLKSKVIAGIFGSVNHDYIRYNYYTLLDSTLLSMSPREKATYDTSNNFTFYRNNNGDSIYDINKSNSLTNLYITTGIYGKFWTHIEGYFSGKVYLAGYKAGQTQIDGIIKTRTNVFRKPFELSVGGAVENIVPSYQLNNYYSNNYIWEQGLNTINKISLSSKLAAPSNKFELTGNYALISNHIYLTDSLPRTFGGALNMISIGVEKEFVVWKLHIYNKLIYQVSGNRDIVEIPSLIAFNSTYFDHTWKFKLTGGSLRTMLGVDIHYNTAFYGYNYLPAMSMFYQDKNKQQIGNYPFIDLWLNVRLKRTRFFVKLEHFNSTGSRKDFYHAISYPAYQRMLKFGLSWTFYN